MMTSSDQNYTLLLVDDNPTNLLLLVKIIELDLPGVRVLTARSGQQGVELARREKVDGAFIDVQMPGMDGLEVCRRLNADPRTSGTPMVLMTAHLATPALRAAGLEAGAYDFLLQPISNVEMLARIKVMLRLCATEHREQPEHNGAPEAEHEQRSIKIRWLSGLLMAGDGTAEEPDQQRLSALANHLPLPTVAGAEELLDCLTTRLPEPWCRTLLKLSLLDPVPFDLAHKLSEINDVKAAIGFLQRHDLVQIKPVAGAPCLTFRVAGRKIMQRKAEQVLDQAERQQLYQLGADWFQSCGNVVTAIDYLLKGEQFQAVSQLLEHFGLTLFDGDGLEELFAGLATIPDTVTVRCAWLSLFRGINGLRNFSPDSGVWLELAFELFTAKEDDRGLLLTLSYQLYLTRYVDGCYERWDQRLPLLKELAGKYLEALEPSERVRVISACGHATLFFDGRLEQLESELEGGLTEAQRLQLIGPQLDLNALRVAFELHRGRFLVARAALEQGFKLADLQTQNLRCSILHLTACEVLHVDGDLEGLQRQRDFLEQSQLSRDSQGIFVPLLIYYQATLLVAMDKDKAALEMLDIARLHHSVVVDANMQSRLLQLRGLCHALRDEEDRALEDMEEALKLRRKAGGIFPFVESFLFAAITCVTLRKHDQAATFLKEGLAESVRTREERCRIGLHAWSACVCHAQGQKEEADQHLLLTAGLLKQQHSSFFWGLTPILLTFLAEHLEAESRHLLVPLFKKYLFASVENRETPIPLLRVYALGGFHLKLGEQVFDFCQVSHASRQIFALLMISPKKSLSLEYLMSLLWPESSAIRARNSFDVAHSRLRKALEESFGKQVRQHYLSLEKGMLSLRNIWIDSNEVEGLISSARYASQRDDCWRAENALWKVERLWDGEFLSGFELVDDVLIERDKLTQLRFEQLELLARLLIRRHRPDEAIPLLLSGIQADPTHDSMIRRLLALYRCRADSRAAEQLLARYRAALIKEEYDGHEIDELIDTLGAQWITLKPE